MSMVETQEAGRAMTFGQQLKTRQSQFVAALPAHIPVERFIRVVMTAIQNNPRLARADQQSLWNASMKAAHDGLLPDGREGALVIYSTKEKGDDGKDYWIEKVQWMPMIAGIRKKIRNSDEIATWDVHCVHEKDQFDFELGDDPYIKHKPFIGADRGPMIAVYSVAVLKSGQKSRDVMSVSDVNYIRDTYSKKDRNGNFSAAWVKSYDEMAKKTVAHRHSKVLPMSTDLADLMRRDEDLYDMAGAKENAKAATERTRLSLSDKLDRLAGKTGETTEAESHGSLQPAHDPETGEIDQSNPASQGAGATTGVNSEQYRSDRAEPSPKDAEASHRPVEASASGQPEDDATDPLLDKARGRATQGNRKLNMYLNTLSDDDRDALRAHDAALFAMAEAADGRGAK